MKFLSKTNFQTQLQNTCEDKTFFCLRISSFEPLYDVQSLWIKTRKLVIDIKNAFLHFKDKKNRLCTAIRFKNFCKISSYIWLSSSYIVQYKHFQIILVKYAKHGNEHWTLMFVWQSCDWKSQVEQYLK